MQRRHVVEMVAEQGLYLRPHCPQSSVSHLHMRVCPTFPPKSKSMLMHSPSPVFESL